MRVGGAKTPVIDGDKETIRNHKDLYPNQNDLQTLNNPLKPKHIPLMILCLIMIRGLGQHTEHGRELNQREMVMHGQGTLELDKTREDRAVLNTMT